MRKNQIMNLMVTFSLTILMLIIYQLLHFNNKDITETTEVVYSINPNSIVEISYFNSNEKVNLVKKDKWVYENNEDFPLNQRFIETMLNKTSKLTVTRYVGEGTEVLKSGGLDNPSNVISIKSNDSLNRIILGSANSATGDVYMTLEGTNKVYTVDPTFARLFSNSIYSMAERENLPEMIFGNVTEFSIERDNTNTLFKKSNNVWAVINEGITYVADENLVNELFGKVIKIRFEEMLEYEPSKEILDKYEMDNPELKINIHYKDDNINKEYILFINDSIENKEGLLCAYSVGGNGIYSIKESSIEPFMHTTYENYLSLSVAPVKKELIEQIYISSKDLNCEYRILRSNSNDAVTYLKNGDNINETEFNNLYYQLYAFSAEKRVSDITEQLNEEPVLSIHYKLIQGSGEDVIVELIPYDQNYYGAKVNGKTLLLVNRQKVNVILKLIFNNQG